MCLSGGLMEQLDKLWGDASKTLKVDVAGIVPRHDGKGLQCWLSRQLKLKSFSVYLNNSINMVLWQDFVTDLDQLRHGNDAAELDLLIDITSL